MNATCLYTQLILASVPPPPHDAVTTTLDHTITTTTTNDSLSDAEAPLSIHEDYRGAMLFTVATVCVYGISIVAFIAGHLQKGHVNKDEEQQISRYLKRMHLEKPMKADRQYHVVRLKSQLLVGSALGQRHNRRTSLVTRPPQNFPGFAMRETTSMVPRGFTPRGERGPGSFTHGDDSVQFWQDKEGQGLGRRQDRLPLFSRGRAHTLEQREQTPSPAALYLARGRRSGVAGLGGFAGDGVMPEVPFSRSNVSALPSIEEDEQSLISVDSFAQNQRRGSSMDQSSCAEESFVESPRADQRRSSSLSQSYFTDESFVESPPPHQQRRGFVLGPSSCAEQSCVDCLPADQGRNSSLSQSYRTEESFADSPQGQGSSHSQSYHAEGFFTNTPPDDESRESQNSLLSTRQNSEDNLPANHRRGVSDIQSGSGRQISPPNHRRGLSVSQPAPLLQNSSDAYSTQQGDNRNDQSHPLIPKIPDIREDRQRDITDNESFPFQRQSSVLGFPRSYSHSPPSYSPGHHNDTAPISQQGYSVGNEWLSANHNYSYLQPPNQLTASLSGQSLDEILCTLNSDFSEDEDGDSPGAGLQR